RRLLQEGHRDAGVEEVHGGRRAQAGLRDRRRIREVGGRERAAAQGAHDQGRLAQEVTMRAADLATAAMLTLLGGVVVLDAIRIGIGWGTDGPRSGFFPFWLGVILIAAAVTIGLQAWR